MSGVSVETIIAASRGRHLSTETAKRLAGALGKSMMDVFDVVSETGQLSDRTIWHHHKLIRAILNAAKKARLIPFNVASEHMDAPKLPREEAQYMDDEQAKQFLSALLGEPDIRIKTALLLDLFTGMRRGELCGLSWTDVDFDSGAIHIRKASQYVAGHGIIETPTKNKSSYRSITVTPLVMSALAEYRCWWVEYRLQNGDRWQGEQERLFIQEDGKPIYPGTINHWLKGVIARNGLPDIHPHTLRHTFVTLQIAAGVDIRTIQSRTGHAQASTLLNIYSHAMKSAQERAAQALDDMLLPAALRK